ncbi:MAG: hypothetical protein K2X47_09260, partial [Bdellovibrionales bacterium]|nr:hypothetical protein [Bdellovibrionales bacterium]
MKLSSVARFLVLMSTVFSVGCTREIKKDSSLAFSVPATYKVSGKANGSSKVGKVTSSSAPGDIITDLAHVIVNASGSGMPNLYCHFQIERQTQSGPCDFSGFPLISVNIPSGPSRLIQVGLAYESETTGLILRYGDVVQNLSPGGIEVPLEITTLGEGGEQGHVSGRYLDSPSSGPTGRLDVRV